jgi:hypothetical protein
LPIAGGTAAPGVGQFGILGGAVINDDLNGFGGRVSFALNEQFSLYGEMIYIDDPFFGVGARFGF